MTSRLLYIAGVLRILADTVKTIHGLMVDTHPAYAALVVAKDRIDMLGTAQEIRNLPTTGFKQNHRVFS